MFKINNITMYAIVMLTVLFSLKSEAQQYTMKTATGIMATANTESVHFTVRIDNYGDEIPFWDNDSRLIIIKNKLYLDYFNASAITKGKTNISPLKAFQTWETDYIKSTMKPEIRRSDFVEDNHIFKNSSKAVISNAWYYAVKIKSDDLYFYVLDMYKNGNFIRISYIGSLKEARIYTKAIVEGLHFYDKEIDIKKLQAALRNKQYHY
jgi:hypothetical protein